MTLPRVLLADDHTLVLEGFRRLLDEQCELVGTVGDGRALLEAIPELKPDIVILDISMPVLNGIDAARLLKVKYPHVKVVFITMHADPAGQTLRQRVFHEFHGRVQVELFHDLALMKLDRARGNLERTGDILHRMALRQKLKDFPLTGREFRP